jgi:carbonic anhydrase
MALHFCSKDALRSLIISQRRLGTREIAVFHHTGCGMTTFSTEEIRQQVKDETPAAGTAVEKIDFLEFGDLESSVHKDVSWLKEHPAILPGTVVTGWVYDVESGKVCI